MKQEYANHLIVVFDPNFFRNSTFQFFSTKYGVAFELTDTDGYAQSKFIQKVFGLLLLKAVLILAYLTTVDLVEW